MWFALTSLTPQGGGEGPKAISGKVTFSCCQLGYGIFNYLDFINKMNVQNQANYVP